MCEARLDLVRVEFTRSTHTNSSTVEVGFAFVIISAPNALGTLCLRSQQMLTLCKERANGTSRGRAIAFMGRRESLP